MKVKIEKKHFKYRKPTHDVSDARANYLLRTGVASKVKDAKAKK